MELIMPKSHWISLNEKWDSLQVMEYYLLKYDMDTWSLNVNPTDPNFIMAPFVPRHFAYMIYSSGFFLKHAYHMAWHKFTM